MSLFLLQRSLDDIFETFKNFCINRQRKNQHEI